MPLAETSVWESKYWECKCKSAARPYCNDVMRRNPKGLLVELIKSRLRRQGFLFINHKQQSCLPSDNWAFMTAGE